MMRSPRVLLLMSEVCANGGIQRFNRTLLAACSKLGAQCDVLSLLDTKATIARAAPDAGVHIEGYSGSRLRFSLAAMRHIVTGGHDHIIVGHINLLEVSALALALRSRARRTFLVGHGIEIWNSIHARRRVALRAIDAVLSVSEYTRESFRLQAPAYPRERLQLFPNALSEAWEHKEAQPVAPLRRIAQRYVLSVTRLTKGDRYKGIVTTLEALRTLPDASIHYVIVGSGDDAPFLQDVARRLGVFERTHWLGSVSDEELVDLYRGCEAFVLPSGKEGFGIVFLEAMFFGAPVIAAAERGAKDVVVHEDNGLLVPYGDVTGLSAAIQRVLDDAALRESLKRRARERVTQAGAFTYSAFVGRCAVLLGLQDPEHVDPLARGSLERVRGQEEIACARPHCST